MPSDNYLRHKDLFRTVGSCLNAPAGPESPSPLASPSLLSVSALKGDAGRRNLDTVEEEVAKLRQLQGLRLPCALLTPLSTRYLAASEAPRRRRDPA